MKKKLLVISVPFIVFAVLYLISVLFLKTSDKLHYICPLYLTTGYQCPGCGGTRALKALLNFNFFESLKYNPIIISTCVFISVIYIRLFANTFLLSKEKQIKIIPAWNAVYTSWTGIMIVFYILRNIIQF